MNAFAIEWQAIAGQKLLVLITTTPQVKPAIKTGNIKRWTSAHK